MRYTQDTQAGGVFFADFSQFGAAPMNRQTMNRQTLYDQTLYD